LRFAPPWRFSVKAWLRWPPLLGSELGVGIADIGVLIGLYFAPGVALALAGGAIGQRFRDKTTVLGAMLLAGTAAAVFDFGAAMILVCPLILWGFNRIATARLAVASVPTLDATRANHSLTLLAVGSDDSERPAVGWRRWRLLAKNRSFRSPKSGGVSSA
jgi:hypothetical protein